jgi:hypothetical protein
MCKSNTVNFFAICFCRFFSSSWSSVVSQLRSSRPTRDDANDVRSASRRTLPARCRQTAAQTPSHRRRAARKTQMPADARRPLCGRLDAADITGDGDDARRRTATAAARWESTMADVGTGKEPAGPAETQTLSERSACQTLHDRLCHTGRRCRCSMCQTIVSLQSNRRIATANATRRTCPCCQPPLDAESAAVAKSEDSATAVGAVLAVLAGGRKATRAATDHCRRDWCESNAAQ